MSDSAAVKKRLVDVYRQALDAGVSLDELADKVWRFQRQQRAVQIVDRARDRDLRRQWRRQISPWVRIVAYLFPLGFLLAGLFLLANAALPIMSGWWSGSSQLNAQLLAPVPADQVLDVMTVAVDRDAAGQVAAATDQAEPEILDIDLDYMNLSNWFSDPQPLLDEEDERQFRLDIPKLDIEDATVYIGGTNLNKGLIQYPGTALPGQVGAPVIFGHSVLRQFYNPKKSNPQRYKSIFSTIMTLEPGDKIYLTHQGVKYTYVVLNKTEVQPTDTYILSQRNDVKLLKLVTCTPEGTYLRRGVVTAQLVE